MKKIFIGLIFVLFDFTLTLNGFGVGLLPDFVGYILLVLGFRELAALSVKFQRAKPFAILMVVYSVIDYVMKLLGLRLSGGFAPMFGMLIGLLTLVLMLYIIYLITLAVADMEDVMGRNLEAAALRTGWRLFLGLHIGGWVLSGVSGAVALSNFGLSVVLLVIGIALVVIGAIIYLLRFNRCRKLHEEAGDEDEPQDTGNPSWDPER